MLDVDVDLRRLDVEFHLGHPAGSRETEDLLVEFRVKHGVSLRGEEIFSLMESPTRNPDGLEK